MNNTDILEDLLSTQKQYIEDKDYQKEHNINEQAIDYAKMWTKATETLIAENKQLKEKNKELEEEDVKIRAKFILQLDNYIPKSKVEELLNKYKYTEIEDSEKIIQFYKDLQSLLGKE